MGISAPDTQSAIQTGSGGVEVKVITTAAGTPLRMTETATLSLIPRSQPLETEPAVFADTAHRFQVLTGIGGALTDASAETFFRLPEAEQAVLLEAYFSAGKGIGYTLARTNMNSCDFSSGSYTYVADQDTSLKTFDITHDHQFKIPFIRKAMKTAGMDLKLFISPWSPPGWMKSNNDMLHGGKLLPEFRRAWADYFIRYIDACEATGIPVWGLSVQNEPMAVQRWESCIFTAEDERDFIRDYLGPALHENHHGTKKLIAWDHNRNLMAHRASVILNDKEAAKYIWGIGFHWYDSWMGKPMYENVRLVSEAYPGKQVMLTEACNFPFSWETIDDWHWGENYGAAMINDFNSGACGWTDWNILLDETGGPNHVGNYCFAPVHGDTRTGRLHFMNSYYYIGHFSKFIRPGAQRIACSSTHSGLLVTGFLNAGGSLAIVVMNPGDSPLDFYLYIGTQGAKSTSPAHSITTYLCH